MDQATTTPPRSCPHCEAESFTFGYIFDASFIAGDMTIGNNLKSAFSVDKNLPIKCYRCSGCGHLLLFAGRQKLGELEESE